MKNHNFGRFKLKYVENFNQPTQLDVHFNHKIDYPINKIPQSLNFINQKKFIENLQTQNQPPAISNDQFVPLPFSQLFPFSSEKHKTFHFIYFCFIYFYLIEKSSFDSNRNIRNNKKDVQNKRSILTFTENAEP